MMMTKFFISFCILFSVAFVKPNEKDLVGLWKATKMVENGIEQDVSLEKINLQCAVEGKLGKFSGNTGKNFFSGLYKVKSKNIISIDGFILSKYQDSKASESFLESFSKSNEFELKGEQLILINSDTNTQLFFNKSKR